MLSISRFLGLAKTDPAVIPAAEVNQGLADLQQLKTNMVPPHTGGWPFLGPTATQILSPAQLRGSDPWPYTEGGIDRPERYVYVVQAGDTTGTVAQKLYGANTRENRRKLLGHTITEGAVLAAS